MAYLSLEDEKYKIKLQTQIEQEKQEKMTEEQCASAIKDLFLGLKNGNNGRD